MIEAAAARDLVERLRRVEERIGRLLTSGWRQARAEAADLRQDADELAEAGLTEVAARVMAVAEAGSAAEALPAMALAASACRLLRLRLLAESVPDGWAPLAPSKSRSRADVDTLLPVARLLLDGREVWACARPTRGQWLLLEPPFPTAPEQPPEATPSQPAGVFERLRQQVGQALGGAAAPRSHWLARQVRGRLMWQARYPLGTDGQVTLCTLQQPTWADDEADDQQRLQPLRQMLAGGTVQNGAYVVAFSGGLRVMELHRKDAASYVWLDCTAAEAFKSASLEQVWAIVWLEGAAVVPVALLTPASQGSPPRLTHLLPGTPTDALVGPS